MRIYQDLHENKCPLWGKVQKAIHMWVVVSAGNPGTGNSREFPDFWHSRFPGIQGRDPGKKNPMKEVFFRQILRGKEFSMGTYFCDFCIFNVAHYGIIWNCQSKVKRHPGDTKYSSPDIKRNQIWSHKFGQVCFVKAKILTFFKKCYDIDIGVKWML